jgi:hypothetical protein
MAEVASAYVSLLPSAKGFGSKLTSQVGSEVKSSGKGLGATFGKMFGAGLGLLGGGAAIGLLKGAIDEATEAQQVGARTENVIKSMGGAANVTAKQVGNLATALSNKVGIDDEAIQSGENLLLTFGNIRNEAGKGNDIFNQTTGLMVDLSAAMGQDMKSSAVQLGKALNDPVKGVTALQRVGVSFTADQKDQIKALVDTGDTLGAQKVILHELNKEFKGAAESMVTPAQKAEVAWGNFKEKLGGELMPVVEDLSNFATNKVIPWLEDMVDKVHENGPEIKAFASSVKDQLLPPLEQLVKIGAGATKFFAGLPGPVHSLAFEVGAAALVVPRLLTSLDNVKASASGYAAKMKDAETRTAALGRAARITAGVGGILLLVDASHRAEDSLSILESAAGGAMTGFAVAGAPGAVIGTVAGALFGLDKNLKAQNHDFGVSKGVIDDYTSSLDSATAAITRQTKAVIYKNLQNNKTLEVSRLIGVSDRDVVSAVAGQEGAYRRIKARVDELTVARNGLTKSGSTPFFNRQSAADFLFALRNQGKQLTANQKALQREIAATATYGGALKKLPHKVATDIRQNGLKPSLKNISALAAKYHLTPKQVKTLVSVTGDGVAVKKVLGLQRKLEAAGRVKPDTKQFTGSLQHGVDTADRIATSGASNISKSLGKGTSKAEPDLGPFKSKLSGDIKNVKSTASTGGEQVGGALKAGVISGFAGTQALLASQAAAAVTAAVRAAKHAGEVHSPSRKMRAIGAYLGEGLALGLEDTQRRNEQAGRAVANAAMRTASAGLGSRRVSGLRTHEDALTGRRLALVVDGRTFNAHVEAIADSRVRSHTDLTSERTRAGW